MESISLTQLVFSISKLKLEMLEFPTKSLQVLCSVQTKYTAVEYNQEE